VDLQLPQDKWAQVLQGNGFPQGKMGPSSSRKGDCSIKVPWGNIVAQNK